MSLDVYFITALRSWIKHEQQVAAEHPTRLADIACGDTGLARAYDALAGLYRDLSAIALVPPNPDHLLRLGPVGELVYAIVGQGRGDVAAFRGGVQRRYPDVPFPTPLNAGAYTLASFNELLVYRELERHSDITIRAIHQPLGSSRRSGDFLLTAATGQSVHVEVTMVGLDPANDNPNESAYRCRLHAKLIAYADLKLRPPVIISADDLAPIRLQAKMAEIRERLSLPWRARRRFDWLEDDCGGGLA